MIKKSMETINGTKSMEMIDGKKRMELINRCLSWRFINTENTPC